MVHQGLCNIVAKKKAERKNWESRNFNCPTIFYGK